MGVHFRELQELVDGALQPQRGLVDYAVAFPALLIQVFVEPQGKIGDIEDRRQRRSEIVRDVRDEVVLQLVELLQLFVRVLELRGPLLHLGLELRRVFGELVGEPRPFDGAADLHGQGFIDEGGESLDIVEDVAEVLVLEIQRHDDVLERLAPVYFAGQQVF